MNESPPNITMAYNIKDKLMVNWGLSISYDVVTNPAWLLKIPVFFLLFIFKSPVNAIIKHNTGFKLYDKSINSIGKSFLYMLVLGYSM